MCIENYSVVHIGEWGTIVHGSFIINAIDLVITTWMLHGDTHPNPDTHISAIYITLNNVHIINPCFCLSSVNWRGRSKHDVMKNIMTKRDDIYDNVP